MTNTRFGWHSGTLNARDGKFLGDLYIQDDIVFSDVSAGTLGVTGGIDMTGTTSAIGLSMTGGVFATGAIMVGTSTSARQTMLEAEDFVLGIYSTCADTDGANTAKPLYVNAQYSGVGQVGRAGEFVLYPTAKMGGWCNALKAYTDFSGDNDGGSTGLASAICAEMKLPNGACAGAFYPLEIEWVGQASTAFSTPGTGSASGFMVLNAGGTVTDFDSDGVFMSVNGLTAGSGKLLAEDSHSLRCDIGSGTSKYLLLSDAADSISFDYAASIAEVIAMTVATTKTVTTGMSMSGAGTYTKGILLDATAIGTALEVSAGSMTDGILISGSTPVDGIHISSACSGYAINITGANTGRAISIGTKVNAASSLPISALGAFEGEPGNNYLFGLFEAVATDQTNHLDELRGAWIRTRVNDGCHIGNVASTPSGFGVCGAEIQLKFYADAAATNTRGWQNSALWAQLETQGTSTVSFNNGTLSSAVLANVGLTNTTVIDAGAIVAGLAVNSTSSATGGHVTTTGDFLGIHVGKSTSALSFEVGLMIADSSCGIGIDVGTATTGISFTGDYTDGIKFGVGQSYTPILIGVKSNSADAAHILVGSTDNTGGVQIFCDDGGDALGSITSPLWARYLITASQSAGPTATGLFAQTKSLTGLTFATGSYTAFKAYNQVGGTLVLNGANTEVGIINAGITYEGDCTVTNGTLSGIDINVNDNANTIGTSSGLLVRKTSGSTLGWTYGINIADAGASIGVFIGTCATSISFGTPTSELMLFVDDGAIAADAGDKGSTAGGFLTVKVGSATRYINLVTGA